LPSTLTFNYPNIAALAGYLETTLPQPAKDEPAGAASRQEVASATDLDALSDDELEARLMARLEQVR
jgi:hypothetical protein